VRIKVILTVVLSLFIASSVVALVVRTIRDASEAPTNAAPAVKPAVGAGAAGPRVIVYCFHGKVRCPTCETIESYAHEAVSEGFADELHAGRIEWRVLEYDDPQNLPLAKEYEVIAPTIVVVRLDGGNLVRWENLSDVWGLVGDKAEFLEFVRKNVRVFLADTESRGK
jgi:hypothetical protein